jgi:penicillin G amidase
MVLRVNRILTYLNYLVAALLAGAGFAGYWFAYRPQAQTSGTAPAPVTAEVSVARDSRGMPYVAAKSLDDLFFAQGYVHAQDRLFQMDVTRRQAAGELSAVVGASEVQEDLGMRRLQLTRLARMQAAQLAPRERAVLAAYARGVNHFIETHASSLPLEFTLLQYSPAPWTVADTMLVTLHLSETLTSSWRQELAKQQMLTRGNPALVEQLFPVRAGNEMQMGSNAWAVSGQHTATGKPLLASDPHLGQYLPGVLYANDLTAPGFHAAGLSLPGIPAVLMGHNDAIAWGMTNLQFDVQDLYLERTIVNPEGAASLYEGAPSPVARSVETLRVRNLGFTTVNELTTRHGPLVSEGVANVGAVQFALRWPAAEGVVGFPLLDLNRAANWQQFRDTLRQWSLPAQNFVYADTAGNIGLQVAGTLPKRVNHGGDVPVDGSSAQFEWDGAIPFDQLPSAYNPPSGRIVSANANPFPADYPYRVSGNFAPPDRVRQITALLEKDGKSTAASFGRIQTDVYSAFHHELARNLAAAAKANAGSDDRFAKAAELLSAWDGQMKPDSAAAMITDLAWQNFKRALAERAAPNQSGVYDVPMSTAAGLRLLRERPRQWFPNFDDVLRRAVLDAMNQGQAEQGTTIAAWRLGRHQQITLVSKVLSKVPLLKTAVRGWMQIGPEETGGAPTTISQRTPRGDLVIGPAARLVIDLGNLDHSTLTLPTGQSGQLFSSHYMDQQPVFSGRGQSVWPSVKPGGAPLFRLTPQ